jgi:hypothetical protein
MEATWQRTIMVHENAEALRLQIELGNDHAVTLTCLKFDQSGGAVLWTGSGEHDFSNDTVESFRRWIQEAMPGTRRTA